HHHHLNNASCHRRRPHCPRRCRPSPAKHPYRILNTATDVSVATTTTTAALARH
ncbi:hypothetical protein R3P38DRAFT_3358047, partial [Favolaschia claudopus]